MERIRLTPPGENRQRGERARLYVRWMPHLGSEAVALYELLRILPDVGLENVEVEELAGLLRSTPESVEESFETLSEAGFIVEHDGWLEVAEHPPTKRGAMRRSENGEKKPANQEASAAVPAAAPAVRYPASGPSAGEIEVVKAEPEGVSADDYFNFMGTLPAPHILEFLNGYCGRDGMSPDVVREALEDRQRAGRPAGRLRPLHPGAVGRAGRKDGRGRRAVRKRPEAPAGRAERRGKRWRHEDRGGGERWSG